MFRKVVIWTADPCEWIGF